MRYKVGDRVRIKSLDWYNENKDEYDDVGVMTEYGDVSYFREAMSRHCSQVLTIICIDEDGYRMKEDKENYFWCDEMIECMESTMSLGKAEQWLYEHLKAEYHGGVLKIVAKEKGIMPIEFVEMFKKAMEE